MTPTCAVGEHYAEPNNNAHQRNTRDKRGHGDRGDFPSRAQKASDNRLFRNLFGNVKNIDDKENKNFMM